MKGVCGNLDELKQLGKSKKNSYTFEQLKDKNLKNLDGESNAEVSERMQKFLFEIIENYNYKKIAIVSHGASIKFFLANYCEFDENMNLYYNNKILNVKSPSIFNIRIKNSRIVDIKQVY